MLQIFNSCLKRKNAISQGKKKIKGLKEDTDCEPGQEGVLSNQMELQKSLHHFRLGEAEVSSWIQQRLNVDMSNFSIRPTSVVGRLFSEHKALTK